MKAQCPRCAKNNKDTKKDNLHIYPDKSSYCFSCGYYTKSPNTVENMKKKLLSKFFRSKNTQTNLVANLPVTQQTESSDPTLENTEISPNITELIPDLTYSLPSAVRLFLASKGINAEMRAGNFFWNQSEQSLVYPVFGPTGVMTFACLKYFGDNKVHPKYITKGNYRNFYNVFGNKDDDIIFAVEDYLSAIRIAAITNPITNLPYASYPIFGSVFIKEHISSLCIKFPALVLMLDPDKRKESIKIKQQYLHMFDHIQIAYTQKDPKDYSSEHLSEILATSYNNAKQALHNIFITEPSVHYN